jgi:protein-S-isoprenylcysteine O-methyltransferase Ste14
VQPYFQAHHYAGLLVLFVTACWGAMELAHAGNTREGAVRIGGGGRQFALWPCLVGAGVMLYLAPRYFPSADMRPAAAVFAAGIVILVGGLVLRGAAIRTLGVYFTGTVRVSSDQPVVTTGPYRFLRHPSYSGLLLAFVGLGLISVNWIGLAVMIVLPLPPILWRIHAEEHALLATLGDRYGDFAAQRKRLIPLVW